MHSIPSRFTPFRPVLRAAKCVEAFVRVTDKREIHLRHVLFAKGFDLRPVRSRVVALVDLVGGKVGHVDVGRQAWFKRGTNRPELAPVDPVEERMLSNFGAAELAGCRTQTIRGITEQTVEGGVFQ